MDKTEQRELNNGFFLPEPFNILLLEPTLVPMWAKGRAVSRRSRNGGCSDDGDIVSEMTAAAAATTAAKPITKTYNKQPRISACGRNSNAWGNVFTQAAVTIYKAKEFHMLL